MALGISIRRQTGGLAPCRLTLTWCTVVAARFGKRGSFWMATRLPPTNVCRPSRSSICCIKTSAAFASACHSIRASSSVDGSGFFGMPAIVPGPGPTLRLIQHLDFGDLGGGQVRQRRRTVPVFDDRPGR
jgi:hypothetical protein